jgi:DNA-directed RNA polymerase specialized sigma24 family protein
VVPRDRSEALIRALKRANLAPEVRTIAFLRYETGLSEEEIAHLTGLPPDVVAAGVAAARIRLRALAGGSSTARIAAPLS